MVKPEKKVSARRSKICCVGEPMIELSGLNEKMGLPFTNVAGDTLNTAVYLKRILGNYADIFYLTVLGKDPLSMRIQDFINEESINTGFIRFDAEKNCGIYLIQNDQDGERTFHYWRENSAARTLFQSEDDFECLESADIIYLSGITLAILSQKPRDKLIKWLGGKGQKKTILFDINFRKTLWRNLDDARKSIKMVMKAARLCFPSTEDLSAIFGTFEGLEFLKEYCKNPNEFCVVKKGGNLAPEIISITGESIHFTNFKKLDKVLDSTGAGDSFNAGFIGAYLMGKSLSNSLYFGSNLALKVLKNRGAICPTAETKEIALIPDN